MTNKKAIRVLENIEYYLKTHTNESCEEEHTAITLAIKALEERPQGEWVDEGQYAENYSEHAYFCKNCDYHIIEKPNMISENRFCKNCGADMRVKNELKEKKND